MRGDTVLGKYVKNKKTYWVCRGNGIMSRNKDCLLDELVDDYQNSIKSRG